MQSTPYGCWSTSQAPKHLRLSETWPTSNHSEMTPTSLQTKIIIGAPEVSCHYHGKCVICLLCFQTRALCSRQQWHTDDTDNAEPSSVTPELSQARLASVPGWPSVNRLSCTQPRLSPENFASVNRPIISIFYCLSTQLVVVHQTKGDSSMWSTTKHSSCFRLIGFRTSWWWRITWRRKLTWTDTTQVAHRMRGLCGTALHQVPLPASTRTDLTAATVARMVGVFYYVLWVFFLPCTISCDSVPFWLLLFLFSDLSLLQ